MRTNEYIIFLGFEDEPLEKLSEMFGLRLCDEYRSLQLLKLRDKFYIDGNDNTQGVYLATIKGNEDELDDFCEDFECEKVNRICCII